MAPRASTQPLENLFGARVVKLLRKEGKLADRKIRALLGWNHSGFGAWRGDPISRHDRRARENLAQYVMRNPFSGEKMTCVPGTGTVLYRSGMSHGKHKKNFEVFDDPAFLAAITQHSPPKGFQMARYYGSYSNRALGERKKLGPTKPGFDVEVSHEGTAIDVADHQPARVPSKKKNPPTPCTDPRPTKGRVGSSAPSGRNASGCTTRLRLLRPPRFHKSA